MPRTQVDADLGYRVSTVSQIVTQLNVAGSSDRVVVADKSHATYLKIVRVVNLVAMGSQLSNRDHCWNTPGGGVGFVPKAPTSSAILEQ